jgi:hypothetical protein
VTGSRVSLDSVIHAHNEGRTAAQIVASFPSLSLEQVHGALAFYLRNQTMLDAYLCEQQQRWEELRQESEARNRDVLNKLRARRDQLNGRCAGEVAS